MSFGQGRYEIRTYLPAGSTRLQLFGQAELLEFFRSNFDSSSCRQAGRLLMAVTPGIGYDAATIRERLVQEICDGRLVICDRRPEECRKAVKPAVSDRVEADPLRGAWLHPDPVRTPVALDVSLDSPWAPLIVDVDVDVAD